MIAVSMTVSSVPAARDCASPFEEEDAKESGNLANAHGWPGFLKIFPTYLRF